jgi:hypothetical protein
LHEALATLERGFGYCVVLADDEFPMSLLEASCQDDIGVLAFETFALQPFGAKRRYRLVERWCYLGRTAASDDEILSRRAQQLDELLGSAMGSSLLPALPCLILLCLQQIDSTQNSQLTDGSFGHLYDALVTTNLSLGGTAKFDIGSKRTVLSRLAYRLYETGERDISAEAWRELYSTYLIDYDASHSAGPFLDELLKSNLITRSADGRVAFRYKYSFCLFVAAFIVKTSQHEMLQQHARQLCERLDEDDAANILLFVAHFAPEGPVSDTLLAYSQKLMPDVAEFDLHQRLLPLGNSDHIHKLSLDADTPEERRNLDRERRDKLTRSAPDNSLKTDGLPEQLVQYIRALRAVHILGQVLKSTSGTLLAERKAELLGAAYGISRRTVAAIVGIIVEEHGALSEELAKLIVQHRPELEGDLVSVRAELMRFLISLCEGVVYNTVLFVSHSVGTVTLRKTYDRVLTEDKDLLSVLFDLAIRLDHFTAFPEHELLVATKAADKKHSPTNVLRLLVWRHLYLFPM